MLDTCPLHVALADIFVAQFGAADSSLARGKFARVEDVLRDASVLHSSHMAEPSQSTLSKQREHHGKTSALRYWMSCHWMRGCGGGSTDVEAVSS